MKRNIKDIEDIEDIKDIENIIPFKKNKNYKKENIYKNYNTYYLKNKEKYKKYKKEEKYKKYENYESKEIYKNYENEKIYSLNKLSLLPKEIILLIIDYLIVKDLLKFNQTCKRIYIIYKDETIWTKFLKIDFKINIPYYLTKIYKIYKMNYYIDIINKMNKIKYRKDFICFTRETSTLFTCKIDNKDYIKIEDKIINIEIKHEVTIFSNIYLIMNNTNNYCIKLEDINNISILIENIYKVLFGKCYHCEKIIFRNKVKKDSINKDRYFYSCKNCNYFMWETINNNSIECIYCNNIINKQIARSKSKYSGYSYYSCKECNYFRWKF